jgi:hypothetical protein
MLSIRLASRRGWPRRLAALALAACAGALLLSPALAAAYPAPVGGGGSAPMPGRPTKPGTPGGGTAIAMGDPDIALRRQPDTGSPELARIPKGAQLSVACYVTGTPVAPGWDGATAPNTFWDKVDYAGQTGYATDAWLDTGGAIDHQVDACPGGTPAGSPSSSAGQAPLLVDCQPSDGSCFLLPRPKPDATAQANLAKMAGDGGHLVLDTDHKLWVAPTGQHHFAAYPLWTGRYAPRGYELYLCTGCFDASDTQHVFPHRIVYLHGLGNPVPETLDAHAPADAHDVPVTSVVQSAADLRPKPTVCSAPCDPADYWRRLGLAVGAPFAVAAAPVLLEEWLVPLAADGLTSVGGAAWARIASATGLSAPRVEQVVQDLEQGEAPEALGEDGVKVAQELETEAINPAEAGVGNTDYADPFGINLRQQLRQQVIDSVWDDSGRLRPAVLTDPETKEIIPGTQLGNPHLVADLTADGSNIADWGKYETGSISSPDGTLAFKVHFYFNRVTGAVNYVYDYKLVVNGSNFQIPIHVDGVTP